LVVIFAFAQVPVCAQGPSGAPIAQAGPTPFSGFDDLNGPSDTGDGEQEIPLVEKPFNELSNQNIDELGQTALKMRPEAWKHAETAHFIVHYRRATEAAKVVREIEFYITFIARALGANDQAYAGKSHIYVFQDETEWHQFLYDSNSPDWFGSFANGDNLYLNVRSDMPGQPAFDSQTLAHETTHATMRRIFPDENWPIWMKEGLAEYMGAAAVAALKHQPIRRHEHTLNFASMSLDTLQQIQKYPDDPVQVTQLYETAEKLIRFIMTELPKERFTPFLHTVGRGASLKDALLQIYPDKIASYDDFLAKYQKFTK
jgi:hypothetical protein